METNLSNRIQAILAGMATVGLVLLAVLNFRQELTVPAAGRPGLVERGPGQPGLRGAAGPARRAGPASRAQSPRPADGGKRSSRSITSPTWNANFTAPPATVPRLLLDHPGRNRARHAGQGHPRAGRPQPGCWPAIHRAHLSGHRDLRPVPALDCAAGDAFLSFLPGVVCAECAEVHGRAGTLDWTVFWTNIVADALQPALFLHFALSFPEERLKRAAPRAGCCR